MTKPETVADVLARKYSDDDLHTVLQDWDHTDPDQAFAMTLAAEVLRLRRIERAMSASAVPVAWMYISASGVPNTPYASEKRCRRDANMFGGTVRPLIFGDHAPPAVPVESLVAAGHVDQSKVDRGRDILRRLATPQPPKPAGAIDLTELRKIGTDANHAALTLGEIGLRGACIDTATRIRALLSDHPAKPAGAVPPPEPAIRAWQPATEYPDNGRTVHGYTADQLRAYGDAREAALTPEVEK